MSKKVFQNQKYQTCIDACNNCFEACEACATECLREQDVKMMTECIQLCRECAEICASSSKLMSMDSDYVKQVCSLCADVCDACSQEKKSIKKWNTASSALKHVEDLLKNVAKWLDKHTTSKWRNSRTDMTVSRGRNVVCEECTFLPINRVL